MNALNRDKIISKIKKCLALATSSNEHEAAAALRQAQKWMQAHGLDGVEIAHADIQEELTRAGAKSTPAQWEVGLAFVVARAFGCRSIFRCMLTPRLEMGGFWVFIGEAPSGEVARYAFEVLFRQLKHARKHYIQTVLRRCTQHRTRRADLFCDGWVAIVADKVKAFSGNASTQARLAAYMERQYGGRLETSSGRDRNAGRSPSGRDMDDFGAGRRAGRNVQLNRGLNGAGEPLALPAGGAS